MKEAQNPVFMQIQKKHIVQLIFHYSSINRHGQKFTGNIFQQGIKFNTDFSEYFYNSYQIMSSVQATINSKNLIQDQQRTSLQGKDLFGGWTTSQHLIYLRFLKNHIDQLQCEDSKKAKTFGRISQTIGTKNALQVRNMHLKLQNKYKSLQNLIEHLQFTLIRNLQQSQKKKKQMIKAPKSVRSIAIQCNIQLRQQVSLLQQKILEKKNEFGPQDAGNITN